MKFPSIYLDRIDVRQDAAGRYCLNDLHKASGGNKRDQPQNFFRLESTKRLVTLLQKRGKVLLRSEEHFSPVNAVDTGPYEFRGTYVVWQLVYAYAMWISEEFHLRVIETFHKAIVGKLTQQELRFTQVEIAYFARYPERRTIRQMALTGEPYWYIGQIAQRTATTVGKAVRHMIRWGLIDARTLAIARQGAVALYSRMRREQRARQLAWPF